MQAPRAKQILRALDWQSQKYKMRNSK